MKTIINYINIATEKVGNLVSWLSVLLVLLISIDVLVRYLFKFTFIWMVELEIYVFGFLFLLGAGYTLKYGKHVRVDVFYAKLSEKRKAWVDLFGGLLYLLPWCLIIISSSWKYAYNSFQIKESSAQAGGLPALYILKFSIVIGFVLLLLQGISTILSSIQVILKKD